MLLARYCIEPQSATRQALNPAGSIKFVELCNIVRNLLYNYKIMSEDEKFETMQKIKEVF